MSKDAEGEETKVHAKIDEEDFWANGLVVLRRNWLEVFTFERWTGTILPPFNQNDQFMPSELLF